MNTDKKVIQMADLSKEGIGKELEIYTSRFSPVQEVVRDQTWKILVENYFSNFLKESDCVVDLGAGDGLFIKNIKTRRRIAVDLSSHVNELSKYGVEVYQLPASELSTKLPEQPDIIFMSNFLEHLPDKRILLEVLAECYKALKPGGKIMILQPNIRFVGVKYWDYVDHHIALTEHSLVEGLVVSGFNILKVVPQFLPYTAKSSLGTFASILPTKLLIKTYLRFPILWKLFGEQTFVVGEKK